MIRVCPKRDAACPHGMDCPYSIDRYHCAQEPKEPPEPRPTPPPVAEDVAERLVARHPVRVTEKAFRTFADQRIDHGSHAGKNWASLYHSESGVLLKDIPPSGFVNMRESARAEYGVSVPLTRDDLGRLVREAWVRWALTQDQPKPSWLVPYDQLAEADKEADRQIGEALRDHLRLSALDATVLSSQAAEIERLTKERDEARDLCGELDDTIKELRSWGRA